MRLHVEVDGPPDGAPVVFLHGVSGSMRTYAWLPGEIAEGRRIVRVDLRGHGGSEHAPGTYDVDRYGEDVVGALRETVGRPAVLVGHSLGGVVAWWVAQRHPELVGGRLPRGPAAVHGRGRPSTRTTARCRSSRAILAAVERWKAQGMTAEQAAAELAAAPDRARRMCDDVPRRAGRGAAAHGPRRPRGRDRPLDARPHRHRLAGRRCPSSCSPRTSWARPSPRTTPSAWRSAIPTWRSSASPAPGTASTTSASTAATTSTALARFLTAHA